MEIIDYHKDNTQCDKIKYKNFNFTHLFLYL